MQRVLENEVSVHSEGCRWMSFSSIGCVESGEKIYTYFFMYWVLTRAPLSHKIHRRRA